MARERPKTGYRRRADNSGVGETVRNPTVVTIVPRTVAAADALNDWIDQLCAEAREFGAQELAERGRGDIAAAGYAADSVEIREVVVPILRGMHGDTIV